MMWSVFAVFTVVAVAFVLWRLWFVAADPGAEGAEDDLAANRELFLAKLAQLRSQLDAGEISAQQHADLEVEFQRQFLADNTGPRVVGAAGGRGRYLVLGGALLVPLLALALYWQLGASQELRLRQLLDQRASLMMAGDTESTALARLTGEVIDALEVMAARQRDNPLPPVLLARLYADQGVYPLAASQYQRAVELLPEDGDLKAEYAQVQFFAAGNQVTPELSQLVYLALAQSPDNQTALGLAGIASFHKSDYRQAIEYWNRALDLLPPDSPSRTALVSGIAAARERLGPEPEAAGDSELVSLSLTVSAAPGIQVAPETTVFIYARAWQGAPMPLAIRRLTVADLPATLVLDESMAMSPEMSLTSVEQVELVARISLAGTPTPAPGDFEGTLGPIAVDSQVAPLVLEIDRELP